LAAGACICLMGGGGKTTLIFQLGRELAEYHKRVLISSLVKAGPANEVTMQLIEDRKNLNLEPYFKLNNPVYLLNNKLSDQKFAGISEAQLKNLRPKIDVSIVECDGARGHPLKAHNERDLILPDFADKVIILIGADAINSKINEGKLHRPDLFKRHWNLEDSHILNINLITRLVTEKKGYLGQIPDTVDVVYFINKAEEHLALSRELAQSINLLSGCPAYYGSLHQGWWKSIK